MDIENTELSWDEWDELNDPRPEETEFDVIVGTALSRRGFMGGVLAFGSGAMAMGTGTLLSSTAAGAANGRFAFDAVPVATDYTVHVPKGYKWAPLVRYGDPLFSDAPAFSQTAMIPRGKASRVFGENTDGMELFEINGHEVIAVNHEYVNLGVNLPERAAAVKAENEKARADALAKGEEAPAPTRVIPASAAEVDVIQNLQGVAVFEVARGENGWQVEVDSPFNRRITHQTEIRISGPAAGHDLLKTGEDPTGTLAKGTLNNCGAGKTPWGTYLTCEENFNGYFGSTNEAFERPDDYRRYGINLKGRYAYERFDARFDISQNPNEPRRHGYIVEIDPSDPASTPVKRTALGRFKHENAACVIAPSGHLVVYMGDDERGEYMYKYVSNNVYAPGGDTDDLMDNGRLYAAKFNWDGTGEWVELTEESTGMSEVEIHVFTRMAATKVGATTMDRPEWVAVNPVAAEGYCALTNNSRRNVLKDGQLLTNAAGQPMEINAPNPRSENRYGQILRWYPSNDDHATDTFRWDLYVMAGNPAVHSDAYAGSPNVSVGNMFNSPDGMMFDSAGILWIQTDGNDSNAGHFEGQGNNQMLAGDPVTGEIRRFMTGPHGSEVTGLTWSADRRTMFVGIQHPDSPFPDGDGTLARSTVIAVWREDGGLVG
ncbi:MAG: PhoX family phosphatase [Boseongicola sp. SB0675_bin_26]|nr:PhoX family phosphatase [Boseongicola sp. SB0675_bin_26]